MRKIYCSFFTLLQLSSTLIAQNTPLTGKIKTSDGKAAAYVNVTVKGTKMGGTTDENGLYRIANLKFGQYLLQVSYVGTSSLERSIDYTKDGETFDFNLDETLNQLDEVTVKAYRSINTQPVTLGKIAISPMDLPQSVAIIGENVIRDQQAQRLSDVIKNVNGVYMTTSRGAVQESFGARGYALGSGNLFKNGSRINTGTMPEMSSLEKVEVLKGSSAILFGNVAPGGIVNMVTKQPKFNWGGEASMRAGSFNLFRPAVDVYGPLSKNIAFRLNSNYEKARSYRDVVSSERFYVNPSFLFKLGNKTDLVVQGDYLASEFTPDFGIGSLDNTKIPDVERGAFFGTPWQYNKIKQGTASANVKHRFNDNWQLNVLTSYQNFNRDYYSTERIQAAANGDWTRPLNKIKSEENYYMAQADLNGNFKTGKLEHKLLVGVDADRYHTTNFTFNNPTTYDKINILDPGKFPARTDIPVADTRVTRAQTPINRFGAYVQDLISITSKLKLLAGVRWSYQEAQPATTTYLLKDSVVKGLNKTDKAFTPRLGLVYNLLPGTAFFASYANSFVVNTGRDIYNNALQPSLVDQYELGIKNDFYQGKLSVNLTAYRIKNNNLAQMAQYKADGSINSDANVKELVGETKSDGVELDITGHPLKGLDLMAGYSYNNMRYTKTPVTKGSYIVGERLVNTPANTANASAFYTFSKTAVKGLKVGVIGVYIGDRFGGWNNTKEQVQNYNRLIPVDGYVTLDLSAGYTFKKISVMAKVSNVTNTFNYYVHENYSINPIPPTQLMATITYKF
ncbi:MAG: TonB-dependent receptor [Bacteroidota bacterium]